MCYICRKPKVSFSALLTVFIKTGTQNISAWPDISCMAGHFLWIEIYYITNFAYDLSLIRVIEDDEVMI